MGRNSPQSMFHHRHRRLRREHGLTGQSALYDSTLTTTTDTDTGRHYEYNMSTSRKLRRNMWSAYEGSGTGKGSGWDYLTITKDGSYTLVVGV